MYLGFTAEAFVRFGIPSKYVVWNRFSDVFPPRDLIVLEKNRD